MAGHRNSGVAHPTRHDLRTRPRSQCDPNPATPRIYSGREPRPFRAGSSPGDQEVMTYCLGSGPGRYIGYTDTYHRNKSTFTMAVDVLVSFHFQPLNPRSPNMSTTSIELRRPS